MKPNSPVLLGREIAFWAGIANALVAVLVGMQWVHWDSEQTSWVLSAIGAVFAVVTAIAVRPFPVPLLSSALTAVLTMAAGFGLNITGDQVSLWNALLVAVFAALTRSQVSPEPSIDPVK